MKKIKKGLLIFLAIVFLLFLVVVGYGFYLKPKYQGELSLKNIDKPTTVYFDTFGIPHIYANNAKDAMETLGYVHAQDRLWQMELMRRIAPGRLSEIFGSIALKNDQFFIGLGIEEASEKAITQLNKKSQAYLLTMAYLDGINQYVVEGKTPIEFQLIGVKREKFTIKDVYNIFGYMAFSFAMAQKTDPLLTDIRNKYGMEYLKDFGIEDSTYSTKIKSAKENAQFASVSKAVVSLLESTPVAPFVGSNSWVIAPQKTKNGKVIFANDPHIGFSQPGTWYEAHLVTPEFELYGCYLAGTPFPLLGHNRSYAYGLTMFENDDIDFYIEENDSKNHNKYKTPKGYCDYKIIKKRIKVKDSSEVEMNIKITHHGPLMNNLIEGLNSQKPIAMSWIYTKQPIQILESVYRLSHSKSISDFEQGVQLIAAPGLNVMYGDNEGNVAWWATGKLYKHRKGVNSKFILQGANGHDEIEEYLDFSKNPSAINPSWNYVYSANTQPAAIDGFLYPGYYLPEDRAKRITQLLDKKSDWDKKSVGEMLDDNTSAVSVAIIKHLISSLNLDDLSQNEVDAIKILQSWKGAYKLNDVAPTIYNKWIYFYLKNTFKDELGDANFELFLKTHTMKQMIAAQIANETSVWWDNIQTKKVKENRSQVLTKSLKAAVHSLEKHLGTAMNNWTWNKVHTVEYQHPLGKVAALRSFFNVGPFEVSGSNEVINNQFFDLNEEGIYNVKGGPSSRRVIDFSDIENCWGVLPTGQSGNLLSIHYADQTALYNAGKFRKMMLNKNEIIKKSTLLIFTPCKN